MIVLADDARHLVCLPYTVDDLHRMAEHLGIGRHFYHASPFPHYDIPVRRQAEIVVMARSVSSKDIVRLWRHRPHCHPEDPIYSHSCCPTCPRPAAIDHCRVHPLDSDPPRKWEGT